ncbi:MAG: alpha-amlyase [Ignavibacteriae bacterium HGW-Ignavibacteriae-2]|jgi:glycosidase|nr:MAG: alpha-amlyase [Ignavibacteriae bacterium HGW-Ignavibacteriae-2]
MKKIKNILSFFSITFLITINTFAQQVRIDKIEPPNWWVGMKSNSVQLMIYGENLDGITASFNRDDLIVKKIHDTGNPFYTFIDVEISEDLRPGRYRLDVKNENSSFEINYSIWKRARSAERYQGFSNEDVIYLIMPDRFANGDPYNDFIEGYIDTMQNIPGQGRSGGDLQGIIDKLSYLKDLGITTLWLTPVTENNTFRSYHGYSSTNLYYVDPRLGSNDYYKKFVEEAHKHGLKVILDHVANHISSDHPWMKNLPTKDWINGSIKDHKPANHNKMIFNDVHADSSTIKEVCEGWFVDSMPDLNQRNSFVANYIIQNTKYWVEFTGLDGIREDTYPYADQEFMAKWAKEIMDEYPTLNIVGEVWSGEPAILAGYQGGSPLRKNYDSNLPALTDFGLRDAFIRFLQNKGGLYEIFKTLSKDYLYADPNNLVVFADNHDVARTMFYADTNVAKAKLVYHMLLTLRGIPQIFYGTEIGMIENEDHGTLRKPFPGGFPGDTRNAFMQRGRTDYENDIYNYIHQLLQIRKNSNAVTKGKLTHFPPKDDVYIYFKTYEDEIAVNIINASEKVKDIDLGGYNSFISGAKKLKNLKTGEVLESFKLKIEKNSAAIYGVVK